MGGALEAEREALVQKIGENITVRRVRTLDVAGGVVGSYVHGNDRIGVLVGLKGGSAELARDVAMHIAAINPQYATPAQVPAEVVEKEREILIAQAADSGKPADIVAKMIEGRVRKFLSEVSLSEQAVRQGPRHHRRQAAEAGGCRARGLRALRGGRGHREGSDGLRRGSSRATQGLSAEPSGPAAAPGRRNGARGKHVPVGSGAASVRRTAPFAATRRSGRRVATKLGSRPANVPQTPRAVSCRLARGQRLTGVVMHKHKDKKYKRILLKLSGEALGSDGLGIDPRILDRMALEVGQLVGIGVQVGLVIGGGNLFRGAALHAGGHGPRHRRSHGHAGHRDERARDARCAGALQHLLGRSCRRSR